MTPDQKTVEIIGRWLKALAVICRHPHTETADEITLKLATIGALLSAILPSGAFTTGSIGHVSRGHAWFPSYDEIRERLVEWWRDNKPATAVLALPAGDMPEGWDAMDGAWLAFWHKRQPEIRQLPEHRHGPMRANLASLVRQQSPRAWGVIANPMDLAA